MRDIDCEKYTKCLNVAAKLSTQLDCSRCKQHEIAVTLGHSGGLKGGPARAKALSQERRTEIAKKAATTRWMREFNRQTKLFNCPFCHGTKLGIENLDINMIAVICENKECEALGPIESTKEKAIRKWNGE